MLGEDTTDCLALANTAILMRLIDELMERAPSLDPPPSSRMPCAICKAARNGARVDDAVRLIRRELMPRIVGSPIG